MGLTVGLLPVGRSVYIYVLTYSHKQCACAFNNKYGIVGLATCIMYQHKIRQLVRPVTSPVWQLPNHFPLKQLASVFRCFQSYQPLCILALLGASVACFFYNPAAHLTREYYEVPEVFAMLLSFAGNAISASLAALSGVSYAVGLPKTSCVISIAGCALFALTNISTISMVRSSQERQTPTFKNPNQSHGN